MHLALLLLAFGLGGSAAGPALPFLVATQLLVGIAAGIALPAIYTLAAIVAPAGRESETIGLVLTGWTLSMVAGVPLSAAIADFAGWRVIFLVVAAAALIAWAAVRMAVVRDAPQAAASPLTALSVRGAAPLLFACAAFMAAFYGVYGYIGDHLHAALDCPSAPTASLRPSMGSVLEVPPSSTV